jgi:hypothetical protein
MSTAGRTYAAGNHLPIPRKATDNPDLNFVLFLIGGVAQWRREDWMYEHFPKTMAMIGVKKFFAPTVRKVRTAHTASNDYDGE